MPPRKVKKDIYESAILDLVNKKILNDSEKECMLQFRNSGGNLIMAAEFIRILNKMKSNHDLVNYCTNTFKKLNIVKKNNVYNVDIESISHFINDLINLSIYERFFI